MKLILFRVHCKENRFGDYAQTANLAYAVQQQLKEKGIDAECVLVSNAEGVTQFERLFPRAGEKISVHDLPLGIANLQELMQSDAMKEATHYVDIGLCSPTPGKTVKEIADKGLQILFVGLPNDPAQKHKASVRTTTRNLKLKPERVSSLLLGYGEGRIGIPLYLNEPKPLAHENYFDLTRNNYGCMYFKASDPNTTNFISDYLSITSQPQMQCKHHVMIGPIESILQGAEKFANTSGNKMIVVDYDKKEMYELSKVQDKIIIITKKPLESIELPSDHIVVLVKNEIKNEEMRSLVKNAIPFVGVTGVLQVLLAVELMKIPFIQYLTQNIEFLNGYQNVVFGETFEFSEAAESKQEKLMEDFMKYILFTNKMEQKDIEHLTQILSDETFRVTFLSQQAKLCEFAKTVAEAVVKCLMNPQLSVHPSALFTESTQAASNPKEEETEEKAESKTSPGLEKK